MVCEPGVPPPGIAASVAWSVPQVAPQMFAAQTQLWWLVIAGAVDSAAGVVAIADGIVDDIDVAGN